MNDQEYERTIEVINDDNDVEIVSLDQEGTPVPAALPAWLQTTAESHLSRFAQLPRRQRGMSLRVMVVLSFILLIVLVLPNSVTNLSNILSGVTQQWLPHSTTPMFSDTISGTIAGGYYLDVSVPWTQVFIDGVSVHIPTMNIDPPLALRPGRHFITWLAVPFVTQFCVLSIPDASGDTCAVVSVSILQETPEMPTQILLLHNGLHTLPSDKQATLLQMTQTALASIQDSQLVQPGELYVGPMGDLVAKQHLYATLHFRLDTAPSGYREYDIDGQFCPQLCIVPWHYLLPQVVVPSSKEVWLALGYVTSYWDYATAAGHVVVQGEKAVPGGVGLWGLDAYPVLLRILWTGLTWQVTPLLGANQAPPIVLSSIAVHHPPTPADKVRLFDNPSCVNAHFIYSTVGTTFANVSFISGPNPAIGCLVVVSGGSGQPSPAYYFEHFGVFLAANERAHVAQPQLPLADTYERTLVAQLLSHT